MASRGAKTGSLGAKLATTATLEPPCPDNRCTTSSFPEPHQPSSSKHSYGRGKHSHGVNPDNTGQHTHRLNRNDQRIHNNRVSPANGNSHIAPPAHPGSLGTTIFVERTEAPSPHPTKQMATQTGPLLRAYRAELKDEIARSDRREQRHKEAMGRLKEEA